MAPGTRCLIGDMGYDADRIRQDLLLRGVLPVVPSNPARTAPLPLHRELYRLRNRIERLNNKLKQFRAVATRYDNTAASYLAFVQLAASRLWLRFVHTTCHYSCIRRFRCERCASAWWARRQHDQAMMRAGWMRRWARRVATRRISWSDQRMRPGGAGRA